MPELREHALQLFLTEYASGVGNGVLTYHELLNSYFYLMRFLILMAMLCPVAVFSQDCKTKKTTDPYTKEIKMSSGFVSLDGLKVSAHADSKEIDLLFSFAGKEKCFNDAATVSVFFDGTKQKANFRNNGPMNCEGFFHVIFKNGVGTPSLLKRLTTQKVSSLEFVGNNKEKTVITLDPDQQENFRHKLECLVNESKSLLPQS